MQCYQCKNETGQQCYDCQKPVCDTHSSLVELWYVEKPVIVCEPCQAKGHEQTDQQQTSTRTPKGRRRRTERR